MWEAVIAAQMAALRLKYGGPSCSVCGAELHGPFCGQCGRQMRPVDRQARAAGVVSAADQRRAYHRPEQGGGNSYTNGTDPFTSGVLGGIVGSSIYNSSSSADSSSPYSSSSPDFSSGGGGDFGGGGASGEF